MSSYIKYLAALPTSIKKIIIISIDIFLAWFSVYLSYVLRFDDIVFYIDKDIQYLIHYSDFLFIIIFFIPLLIFTKFYSVSVRYYEINLKKLINFFFYSTIYIILIYQYNILTNQIFSKSVLLIQPFLFFMFILSFRKVIHKVNKDRFINYTQKREKIILVGEEEGLNQLKQYINLNTYEIIGFYDHFLENFNIPGITRISNEKELKKIINQKKVSKCFVVYSENSMNDKSLQNFIKKTKINFKIYKFSSNLIYLNDFYTVDNNLKTFDQILEKKIYDYSKIYNHYFNNKEILITGGAGSIGRAILEQLLKIDIKKIHILDSSEISIFNLKTYLKQNLEPRKKNKIFYHLTSINNEIILNEIFKKNKIDIVYHAAAYKHVDLAQENIQALVHNNVLGTNAILSAVKKFKIKKFVFISSDKAVNPVGIMGITKKIGEYLTKYQLKNSNTNYSMVRFGNVIGSSGSVIPLFIDQIEQGGPVTITHSDVTRYFMSSLMAAQLVLISSTISNLGNIFVLDMGKPFKIQDLAKKLINLHYKNNGKNKNIKIKYIGLKDGEKLHEELALGENLEKTKYKKILIAKEQEINDQFIKEMIDKIYNLYQFNSVDDLKDYLLKNISVK